MVRGRRRPAGFPPPARPAGDRPRRRIGGSVAGDSRAWRAGSCRRPRCRGVRAGLLRAAGDGRDCGPRRGEMPCGPPRSRPVRGARRPARRSAGAGRRHAGARRGRSFRSCRHPSAGTGGRPRDERGAAPLRCGQRGRRQARSGSRPRSGRQAGAALGATRREHLAAADGAHAGAEAVRPRAFDLGGLERAFHVVGPWLKKPYIRARYAVGCQPLSARSAPVAGHWPAGRVAARRRGFRPARVGRPASRPVDNSAGDAYNPQPSGRRHRGCPGRRTPAPLAAIAPPAAAGRPATAGRPSPRHPLDSKDSSAA